MVYKQVPGDRGKPSSKRALLQVVGGERPIDLDKDLLSQVFGVIAGIREPVTDVVDASVIGADNLLPGIAVASNAPLYERGCELWFVLNELQSGHTSSAADGTWRGAVLFRRV